MHNIKPGSYHELNALAMEHMSKRPATGGKCMGYWTAQMGAINQWLHLWQFDSLEHRYECRKELESDQQWQRVFYRPMQKHLTHQQNLLLTRVYREGTASTLSYKYLMQVSPHKEIELSGPSAILAATFNIAIGDGEGKYLHIVKARKLDDLIPINPPPDCVSKIMGPCRWSTSLGCVWR
ncbi:hypothetical protein AGDE_00460 [Angomonas deanei]|nr:hypothetical protein AGDE_02172 [Angomonas deanei]EPY43461.1 hypothetical protein AGDE_00460 [Angomonas deanei]|eukprot:EPY41752.1 hypothetical protein AGDE_02172 [Angomonas deanei]